VAWWFQGKFFLLAWFLILKTRKIYLTFYFIQGILMADKQEAPGRVLKFKEKMDNLLFKCENSKLSGKRSKIKLDIEIELYKSFLRLGSNAQDQDVEDILYFLIDAYNKYNDQQIGYDEIDLDQVCSTLRLKIITFLITSND
jgi:hypothetical protein